MMTAAFPLSRSAKVAVSTHPANEWGPDETLHAWEIVMFKDLYYVVNDLLEQSTSLEAVAPLSQPASLPPQYTHNQKDRRIW